MAFGLCATVPHSYEWGYTLWSAHSGWRRCPMCRRYRITPCDGVAPCQDPAGRPQLRLRLASAPSVQGQTRAQSISNQHAIELAIQYSIAIQYDGTAQAPYFHYTDASGTVHEVWFEDARSLEAKLRLIAEYGFLGAGIWNIMRPFSQLWLVADSLYDIEPPF